MPLLRGWRAFWADRAANEGELRTNLFSLVATRRRHVGSDPDVDRYDPDRWTDELAFLGRPGQAEIQSDIFYDAAVHVLDAGHCALDPAADEIAAPIRDFLGTGR